jgi:hypothetical protein
MGQIVDLIISRWFPVAYDPCHSCERPIVVRNEESEEFLRNKEFIEFSSLVFLKLF